MATDTLKLVDRVVVFFARNPEEELSSADIAVKFNVPLEDVFFSLRHAVQDQRIAKAAIGSRANGVVYSAGPALLNMIGWAMEACATTGNF